MATIHLLRRGHGLARLQLARVPCVGEIIYLEREAVTGHFRVAQVAHVPDSDQADADVWVDTVSDDEVSPWR